MDVKVVSASEVRVPRDTLVAIHAALQSVYVRVPARELRVALRRLEQLLAGGPGMNRRSGQSLVLVALLLPPLLALLLLTLDMAERAYQRALLDEALRDSARAALQTFRYSTFAGGTPGLRSAEDVRAAGQRALLANLAGIRGLHETPAALVARVEWMVLPRGGRCRLDPRQPELQFEHAAVCAVVRPQLRGLLGAGTWTPLVTAAVTFE